MYRAPDDRIDRSLRRRGRTSGRVAVVVLLSLVVAGCSAGAGPLDDSRAPVVLVPGNLTQTSDPFGDVLTSGGTIPPDTITADFTARLKNPSDLTGPALQDVVIERYEVTFQRTDGGTAVPPGFQRATNARVRVTPHGQQNELITTVDLVLVPATIKSQPPISHLISPGVEPDTGFVNIQATATIRFFGTTVAGEPVSAEARVGINFADFADSNS